MWHTNSSPTTPLWKNSAEETIEVRKADIQKVVSDAVALTKKIAKLDEDIAMWKEDIKAVTKVREG